MADRAIRDGRKRHPLTISELFPDGDAAAQWVFSLTALAEDLNVLVKPLRQAHDQQDLRASLYFYRQLVTRLYEARRIAATARTVPEIASFVGDLLRRPPGGINLEQAYRRDPEDEPSRVEQLYAELRHRTVHFPQPANDELAEVLWQHSGYPAQIALGRDEDGRPTVWFQWVHAVTAGDVFGDVRDPEFLKSMTDRSNLVAALSLSWTMAAAVAVPLHARRLGIDSARLGQVPAGP
jgi:hypothetical protein